MSGLTKADLQAELAELKTEVAGLRRREATHLAQFKEGGEVNARLQSAADDARSKLRSAEVTHRALRSEAELLKAQLERKDETLAALYVDRSRLTDRLTIACRALNEITGAPRPHWFGRRLVATATAALAELKWETTEDEGAGV